MAFFQSAGLQEKSREAVVRTLAKGAFDTLFVKALDGATWEGHWDGGPFAVDGWADLQAWERACDDGGVTFIPWVQPDAPGYGPGQNGSDREQVARQCGEMARGFDAVVLDCEPGADYWKPLDSGDFGGVRPFFQAIRDVAGSGAKVGLWYPAGWAIGAMRQFVGQCPELFSYLIAQDYWNDTTLVADEATMRGVYGGPIYHCPATFGDWPSILKGLERRGVEDVVVWDFAHMTAATYAAFSAWQPNPHGLDWQAPGFAALHNQVGAEMGAARTPPFGDSEGNVWQRSATGRALWVKAQNRDYWLPDVGRPAVLGE